VAESQAGRRQVSATARRYSLSVSQLFTWCRLAREGRLFEGDEATTFAPVLISSAPSTSSLPSLSGRIEIVLRCGRRVIVDNGVDSAALARVLAVLERP